MMNSFAILIAFSNLLAKGKSCKINDKKVMQLYWMSTIYSHGYIGRNMAM